MPTWQLNQSLAMMDRTSTFHNTTIRVPEINPLPRKHFLRTKSENCEVLPWMIMTPYRIIGI